MTSSRPDGYLFVSAAARELELTADTVRSLFDSGLLAGTRSVAGYRLIDASSVASFKRHLSVSETAQRLGVSVHAVRDRFDAGVLTGFRAESGRRWIDPESLTRVGDVAC